MPITTSTPISIEYPEVSYDRLGVQLAISPNWQNDGVEACVSLTATPYRVLLNGKIDKREDAVWTFSSSSVFKDSETDPALAEAAETIMGAIQKFLAAKGV